MDMRHNPSSVTARIFVEQTDPLIHLVVQLRQAGHAVVADERDLLVFARGRMTDSQAALVRLHAPTLHARLLAEQGRPLGEADYFAGEDLV